MFGDFLRCHMGGNLATKEIMLNHFLRHQISSEVRERFRPVNSANSYSPSLNFDVDYYSLVCVKLLVYFTLST